MPDTPPPHPVLSSQRQPDPHEDPQRSEPGQNHQSGQQSYHQGQGEAAAKLEPIANR